MTKPESKKCPNCGACQECGAPRPYPVYPAYPYYPWQGVVPPYPRPYYGTITGKSSQGISATNWQSNTGGQYQ